MDEVGVSINALGISESLSTSAENGGRTLEVLGGIGFLPMNPQEACKSSRNGIRAGSF